MPWFIFNFFPDDYSSSTLYLQHLTHWKCILMKLVYFKILQCSPYPHWRTLSRSGLQPNVAQIVPFIRGLCHAADFNQMWPKICPLSEDFVSLRTSTQCGPSICPSLEDFVTQWTSTKCGPNMYPSTDDFVLLRGLTTYGSTTYSSLKMAGTKQTDSNRWSTQN